MFVLSQCDFCSPARQFCTTWMASCKGPILAALIYILSTAPAKRFRFALPKKGNESWAGLMLFCFFAVRSWRRCHRSVLHCCATGGRKGWRRFTLTSDNNNMNEQINKQTKTKSKLPQCCLFANRLEKPCKFRQATLALKQRHKSTQLGRYSLIHALWRCFRAKVACRNFTVTGFLQSVRK